MEQKPWNLESTLDTLRREEAAPHAKELAIEAYRVTANHPAPGRPTAWSKLAAVGGVLGGIALIVLRPSYHEGMAWAQVVAALDQSPKMHQIMYRVLPDGSKVKEMEDWYDGRKRSFTSTRWGTMLVTDGRRTFTQARGYGVVSNYAMEVAKIAEISSIKTLLTKDVNGFTLEQMKEGVMAGGKTWTLYRFKTKLPTKDQQFLYYVDPSSSRIGRFEIVGSGKTLYVSEMDYPTSVDPSIFTVPPKTNVHVYDREVEHDRVAKMITRSLGRKSAHGETVDLKVVSQDPANQLTVIWEGTPVSSDIAYPLRIAGEGERSAFGLAQSKKDVGRSTYGLTGIGLPLSHRIDGPVTISIPVMKRDRSKPLGGGRFQSVKVGAVTFRNVTVIHTLPLFNFFKWFKLQS